MEDNRQWKTPVNGRQALMDATFSITFNGTGPLMEDVLERGYLTLVEYNIQWKTTLYENIIP